MNKEDLRILNKKKRSQLSTSEINSFSKKIFDQIIGHFTFEGKITHVFISIKKFNEPDTSLLIDHLFSVNCSVATSITHFSPLSLSHCLINSNTKYKPDQFEIPSPVDCPSIGEKEFDIIIVPLLGFDMQGARVGYGKGLYDQFLAKCKPNCIKIGISFFPPVDKINDTSTHDIPLDFCVTPETVFKFK